MRFEPIEGNSGTNLVLVILERAAGNWQFRANMTVDQFQAAYNELSAQGYHLYSIRVLVGLYSVIWYQP